MCYSRHHPQVFCFLKNGVGGFVPGLIKDLEWMREVLMTLECPGCMPLTATSGSFTDTKMKGSHAEGNESDVTGVTTGALRCHGLMSGWSSLGSAHPPPICTTVLVHRATLITVQAFYVKSCV